MKLKMGLVLGALFFSVAAQAAPMTSDQMTCAQAVATYAKYKRIYVVAHGNKILPIYGMRPITQERGFSCTESRSKRWKTYYRVRTLDNSRCNIAVYCSG